jgi:hypothetical protein
MALKAHSRSSKVVLDKHLDSAALGEVVGRNALSATNHRPQRKYRGDGADAADEDFYHILLLAWEEMAPLLTSDREMIEKAKRFPKQYPREESCLRGVILLPPFRQEQLAILRRFVAGEVPIIASRKGGIVPKSLNEIELFNLGLDLCKDHPRVVELCGCGS